MIKEAFCLLERFVVAVEKIAEEGCICCKVETAVEQPKGSSVEIQAKQDTAALNREFIKSELVKKGVPFKTSAKTETLQKLLEETVTNVIDRANEPAPEAKPEPPVVAEKTPDPPIADGPRVPRHESTVPTITKEMVRDKLVELSAAQGKDAALKILKTVGQADKLSDVNEVFYLAIHSRCAEMLGGNNGN